MEYDAQIPPNAEEWLSFDEDERVSAIIDHHDEMGEDLPNSQIHAVIHAVVENQIAMGEQAPARAVERLVSEGLDRHEAIHAVGSILSEQMFNMLKGRQPGGHDADQYAQKLSKLTAKKWRKMNR